MQDSVGFDPSTLIREPIVGLKVYVVFLVVMALVTIAKLIRIWSGALPFRLSGKANSLAYLQTLQASSKGLGQWIGCAFLGWGLLSCEALYNLCSGVLDEKLTARAVIAITVEDFASWLGMTLCVVLFAFIVRWHMLVRIAELRRRQTAAGMTAED